MAKDRRTAENFVVEALHDSIRRLNYIDRVDRLLGRRHLVIHVHPTAEKHRDYIDMMEVARRNGCLFLHVDDTFARERYYMEQMRTFKIEKTIPGSPLTARIIPKWEIDP